MVGIEDLTTIRRDERLERRQEGREERAPRLPQPSAVRSEMRKDCFGDPPMVIAAGHKGFCMPLGRCRDRKKKTRRPEKRRVWGEEVQCLEDKRTPTWSCRRRLGLLIVRVPRLARAPLQGSTRWTGFVWTTIRRDFAHRILAEAKLED